MKIQRELAQQHNEIKELSGLRAELAKQRQDIAALSKALAQRWPLHA